MVDVTLLEVNLEESSFDAHAPFSGRGSSGDADDTASESAESESVAEPVDETEPVEEAETEPAGDGDDDAGGLFPMLVGGVLAVAAVIAWRLRGRGGEEPETDEEVVEVEV